MKTASVLVATAALALIATPAVAGKKRSKKKAPKVVEVEKRLSDTLGLGVTLAARTGKVTRAPEPIEEINTGASFDLTRLDRDTSMPTGDAELVVRAQPLSAAQVGQVVKAKMGTLDYCWSRLPAAQRVATTIGLQFTIEPAGTVSAFAIGGEVPAKAARCITASAKRWTFPVADTQSIVEYAVDLK